MTPRPSPAGKCAILALVLLFVYLVIPGHSPISRSKVKIAAAQSNVRASSSDLQGAESDQRANATLYTLCRNDDLQSVVETILSWEDRFNHRYHYDWVFLNNEAFSPEFQEITSRLISGKATYGVVPESEWSIPKWIDHDHMREGMNALSEKGIQYADSESYRFMCRYNSGLFYNHKLLRPYRYIWRVDADTKMLCDLDFDVLKYIEANDIKYAFTLSMHENLATIPTLWESTLRFLQQYPEYIHADNLAGFVSDDLGRTYNGCHFWTNFEISDADIWRSEPFASYFEFLDQLGGFFYERWGDAPVHSLAAALMLPKKKVAHLDFVGYFHAPVTHIPSDFKRRPHMRCAVNPERNFSWDDQYNCVREFYRAQNMSDGIPARMQ